MTRRHRNLALHHLTVLAVLSTTVLPGAAAIEDLDPEDVPPECALACAPIKQLTERCEAAAEQQFGAEAVNRRWATGKQRRASAVDGGNGGQDKDAWRGRRRPRGARRSLQRMLGSRLDRRQEEDDGQEDSEESSDDSDSDDSDDDEEEEKQGEEEDNLPAAENAAETGGIEEEAAAEANQGPAVEAMRACVCGETGFDVAVAALGCAACAAQNATAEDANEGELSQPAVECAVCLKA
ncbi:uncharacterized protein LY79DRAFT_562530 [Colletotrichum navitas]|uniref:Uncharacterized protein n=1 Tax=Colletotrichum navitas TaxID=681940 RepID=A0AAD8V1Q1_9PEZI|nr:uncharacterized protein LY79DRAFT_562530 [Colletotrichum navitas]KAK1580176.1 hypothetical protein LY79DRAFT_562530 [Colletotrichum navitas]